MEPATMAAGGMAASGILDSIIGGATAAMNVHEARENRRFQRNMANTAHQREVEDLQKAGLNPILSAKLGGAATPPGSAAHLSEQAAKPDLASKLALAADIAVRNAQAEEHSAGALVKREEASTINMSRQHLLNKMVAEINSLQQQTGFSKLKEEEIGPTIRRMEQETKLKALEAQHSALGMAKSKTEKEFYEGTGGQIEHWLKMLGIEMPKINIQRRIMKK